jgi:O-methyltransferase
MSASTSHDRPRRALPEHLDTPLYRVLLALGLFHPLRRVSRAVFRYRTQRRALRGAGLVPEPQLKATYEAAVLTLRDRLGPDIGDYLEFGVCHGSSMSCMHDVLKETGTVGVRKFGFDSFQGLPPEADDQDGGFFSRGQFDSSLAFTRKLLTRRGIDWNTTVLIEGWFRDTCTAWTAMHYGIRKVGIVMIDCDIYSASKEALDFAGPLLGEQSILIFDDWNSGNLAVKNMGQRKAYEEFMAENRDRFVSTRLPEVYPNSAVFHLARQ